MPGGHMRIKEIQKFAVSDTKVARVKGRRDADSGSFKKRRRLDLNPANTRLRQ